ncbi:MAG: ABC transporter ATP-binding protein [Kiritimatiellia bacterium]|jgi:ABC-2 type transport system ATP-binding protein|nr:ABC transporter ATP-binding protein [Kiritimatiellia bacterium]MDP6848556.1 ABC transporter ATP-binding protein [Kiritimatiellia bacterium]
MNEKPDESVVVIENLTKVFKDFWRRPKVCAVDNISISIKRGEVFGLLGPNGSGKSTTIKVVLGLLHATRGQVRVLGRVPTDVSVKERLGYLPEESHLYLYLTARETLDLYGKLFALEKRIRKERTEQLLEMLGLVDAADRPVGEFSKGMARRIGLAQALINDPDIVILDEPTSGLDPVGCRQVKDLILTLAGRGKTILLCSHLLADVEDVCDRIAILYRGRIRAHGQVSDLLEERDSLRVTMPAMPPGLTQEVLKLLKEKTGTEPALDHPAMDLETFFLDVLKEASARSEPGSRPAGERSVADYLRPGS